MTKNHRLPFVHQPVSETQGNGGDAGLRLRPGEQAMRYLLEEIKRFPARDGAAVPGRVLPTDFMGGATTPPQENELLRIIE